MSVPLMPNIDQLFIALNNPSSRVQRNLWWITLVESLRGDGRSPQDSAQRTINWLDTLDARPDLKETLRQSWLQFSFDLDRTLLLADFGFSARAAFISALANRLRNKWLPKTPDTMDAAELFALAFNHVNDSQWLALIDASTLVRIQQIVTIKQGPIRLTQWQTDVLDAIEICVTQICANGFSSELRLRMDPETLTMRPFHRLGQDFQIFRQLIEMTTSSDFQGDEPGVAAAAACLREQLEACRLAIASTYTHLDSNGISLGLVYRIRQVRERILRIRDLMDCVQGEKQIVSTQKLFSRLATLAQSLTSIRSLVKTNTSMLASKVTQRSAQTGEAYITRSKSEFWQMFKRACGGGAIVSLTTIMKFVLLGLATSAFWSGLLASANYAISFIVIQLLHWTLATKQPAMTAPAMAARLRDVAQDSVKVNTLDGVKHAPKDTAQESFVDEVTHLVRSQTAAVMGNLLLVVPCVLLVSAVIRFFSNGDLISADKAQSILNDLSPLGFTCGFAAFTGILLFASSIMAGWTENWFVLHRIESALTYNPRINRIVGPARCARWAIFWRQHIVSFAGSISLGLLLGLVPAAATFFGLGLEVRHVTLSAGQVALAASVLGQGVLYQPNFWLAVAAVPLIGVLNVVISFACALRLALAATAMSGIDRKRILAAIVARVRSKPLSFVWPKRLG